MLHLHRGRVAALVLVCVVFPIVVGCAGSRSASHAVAPTAIAADPDEPPPPLAHSVFARDPNGQLSEEALQRILASPIELELPSRVGVLPIQTATDWRGPGPDERVPAGVPSFVDKLRHDAAFSLVTQTMVIPSGALGMEALREIAARYRLRYLVLYREVIATSERLDRWAIGYATLLGALFLPGNRQELNGYLEASMLDVKTGLLMFTARRAISASQLTNEWHTRDKLDKLASRTAGKFAPDLAADLLTDLRRFAAAAAAERDARLAAQ